MPARLRADPDRISQILANLVARALTVTRQGLVSVRLAAAPEGRRTRLTATVSDGGPELTEHEREHLFDPFHRSGRLVAADDAAGGTGLGLAISRQLTAAMGGVVRACASPGGGSALSVELLVDPPRGLRTDAADDATRARVADRRALVVSAEPCVREALGEMLSGWGARLETADEASASLLMREAVDLEDPFEVVVWDVPDDDLATGAPHGGFIAWCADEMKDPRHVPGAGEALFVERPLTRRALRAAVLRSDGVVDPESSAVGTTAAQAAVAALRPRHSAEDAQDPATASDEPLARVLLVQANPVNSVVARRMLEDLGCAVDVAEDGAQAVGMFSADRHDLVLLDLHLPVMDGIPAAEAMQRKSPDGPRTPLIAIIDAGVDTDRARALHAGMNDIIVKPFCAEDVHRVVLRWAHRKDHDVRGPGANVASVTDLRPGADRAQRHRTGDAAT